jgi:hypothetical protein
MANLILFVKNDESEAENTVPTSVAPGVRAMFAASLPHGHADQTNGRGLRGTDAAIDIVVSRA